MSQPISDAEIDIIVSTTPIQSIAVGEVTNQPVAWDIGEVPNLISNGLPAAGTTGQQLAKKSNNDYDTQWVTPHEIPAGGAAGTVLGKASGTDYDTQWTALPAMPLYDECGSLTPWTRYGSAGSASVATVTDSSAGGKVIRCVGQWQMTRSASLVPYDPNVLYRVKFRLRQTVDAPAGQAGAYLGLTGVGADGVTLVNANGANSISTQHYGAASNQQLLASQGWQEFVAYFKGFAPTPPGTWKPPTTASTPGNVHSDVRYIQPLVYVNSTGGATGGVTEIDYVSLEIVTPTAVANSTEITLSGDGAGTPLSAALTGVRVLPTGGAAGAQLAKNTATNYDVGWVTPHEIPTGGTTGQVLAKSSATDYATAWVSPTLMRVSRAAGSPQSIPNTTYTVMSFPTLDEDPMAMANAGGDQFTIKKAGIWTASLCLTWVANATGFRIAWIYVNGLSVIGQAGATGGSYGFPNNVSGNLRLAVNDIVTVQGYQSSGAALNTGSPGPSFALLWQGP